MADTKAKKLLLVDDEERFLETFSLLLEDFDFQVSTATNASDALELVSKQPFDIVFMDHLLGSSRGLEVIRRMEDINPELYYVMITANGTTDLAVEALKSGVSDFITKPLFVSDIVRSVEHVNRQMDLDRQKKSLLEDLERKVGEKTAELEDVYLSVLSSLAQAVEKKDLGTYGHSRRVTRYCIIIARAMGLEGKPLEDLKAAAILHDIGKIGISDFILAKPGPLDGPEMESIRSHPQKGIEILKPIARFKPIMQSILHHHENFDGSGYPMGLSGEDIPLSARIISVADTYDAILSDRPYRDASDHNRARNELLKFSGIQFDPKVVDAFQASEHSFPLSTGKDS